MNTNKKLLIAESTVYAVLCAVSVLLNLYDGFTVTQASVIYIISLVLTFGYFTLLETVFKHYDVAVHSKSKKSYYVPTGTAYKKAPKRKGLGGVLLLWLFYLTIIGVSKLSGTLTWQFFCAGGYLMFMLNSIFTRKRCVLSMAFLHNKNDCCKHCTINGWDYAIFTSALFFAPHITLVTDIINVILIILGLIKFIMWEVSYRKNPSRFFVETNKNLSCKNCIKKCRFANTDEK